MQLQLQAIIGEFESASDRLHSLRQRAPERFWPQRPEPTRWSVAECIAHLNLTSSAYLPLLRDGIDNARRMGAPAPRLYRRDPIGWLLWRMAGPPVRFRVKTTPRFVPAATNSSVRLIAEFERLQGEQLACVRDADGLSVDRVKITSPFDARVKYNLYAAMAILPRHQHRHLWQAERAWRDQEQGSG